MEADDIQKRVGKSIKLELELRCCAKHDNLRANSNSFRTSPVPSEAFRCKAIWISFMNPWYYTQLISQHPFPTFLLFVQQKISYKFQEEKSLSMVPFLRAPTVQKNQGM